LRDRLAGRDRPNLVFSPACPNYAASAFGREDTMLPKNPAKLLGPTDAALLLAPASSRDYSL